MLILPALQPKPFSWPVKDSAMQRIDEYRFYELGQKIGAIQGLDQGALYNDAWDPLWDARAALERLRSDAVSVRISLSVVDRLIDAITAIVPKDISDAIKKIKPAKEGEPPPAAIGWLAYELNESLKQFEPVLAAECNALDTYVVSQKRGYSTPDLIERADIMLPIETRAILAASVQEDIKASGRCLAFDVPTAAGFHILRAVEAVMAMYYAHLTGRELQKRNRNWAIYLKKLSEDSPTSDPKIFGALDHIRDNYRNPIAHPEDTLTEGQAIMVFSLSLSVIELMAEVMRTTPPALSVLEKAKALTALAESEASSEPLDF